MKTFLEWLKTLKIRAFIFSYRSLSTDYYTHMRNSDGDVRTMLQSIHGRRSQSGPAFLQF